MMEEKKVFEKLTKLQECLTKKFDLEKEIEMLPKDLKVKQELLDKINKEYTEGLANDEKANNELKDLRFQYNDIVAAREASEKKMETISTQREFEALEKEIKDAGEKEQLLLKQVRAKEQQVQDMDAEMKDKESLLKMQQTEVATEEGKIEGITAGKVTERNKLEEECKAFIDEDITLDLYEKFANIVKNKEGKGIVPIHGLVCQGCHIMLPIQFVNDVRSGKGIEFCPYCSRILYYEETEGAEEEFKKPIKDDTEDEEEDKGTGSDLSDFTDQDEFNDILS
jgi:predicted  nucleic acid-binding Zn-ribbon protein